MWHIQEIKWQDGEFRQKTRNYKKESNENSRNKNIIQIFLKIDGFKSWLDTSKERFNKQKSNVCVLVCTYGSSKQCWIKEGRHKRILYIQITV